MFKSGVENKWLCKYWGPWVFTCSEAEPPPIFLPCPSLGDHQNVEEKYQELVCKGNY